MQIQENISLKDYTTFQIGGSARYFVDIDSIEALQEALQFAQKKDVPHFLFAGGSNVLFLDEGYPGLVMRMQISTLDIEGQKVHVGAGYNLSTFLDVLAREELSGLEKLAGVPGSVGGAARGNAGAFGTEISDWITSVTYYDIKAQKVVVALRGNVAYSYRSSFFKEHPECIILSVDFVFEHGNAKVMARDMAYIVSEREKRHIQNIKSAGSFFMNPEAPKDVVSVFEKEKGVASRGQRVPAGWLLECVGLDQKKIGGVQAGAMHANYFINVGDGRAAHALQLASLAKTRVRDTYGIKLTEEVTVVFPQK